MRSALVQGPAADGSGELPPLEHVCEDCNGVGQIAPHRTGNAFISQSDCTTCNGTGTLLTEDGKRLLAMLRRHNRI